MSRSIEPIGSPVKLPLGLAGLGATCTVFQCGVPNLQRDHLRASGLLHPAIPGPYAGPCLFRTQLEIWDLQFNTSSATPTTGGGEENQIHLGFNLVSCIQVWCGQFFLELNLGMI